MHPLLRGAGASPLALFLQPGLLQAGAGAWARCFLPCGAGAAGLAGLCALMPPFLAAQVGGYAKVWTGQREDAQGERKHRAHAPLAPNSRACSLSHACAPFAHPHTSRRLCCSALSAAGGAVQPTPSPSSRHGQAQGRWAAPSDRAGACGRRGRRVGPVCGLLSLGLRSRRARRAHAVGDVRPHLQEEPAPAGGAHGGAGDGHAGRLAVHAAAAAGSAALDPQPTSSAAAAGAGQGRGLCGHHRGRRVLERAALQAGGALPLAVPCGTRTCAPTHRSLVGRRAHRRSARSLKSSAAAGPPPTCRPQVSRLPHNTPSNAPRTGWAPKGPPHARPAIYGLAHPSPRLPHLHPCTHPPTHPSHPPTRPPAHPPAAHACPRCCCPPPPLHPPLHRAAGMRWGCLITPVGA